MHRFTFKAVAIIFTLLWTALLPTTSNAHDAKLGCMSCHQGESMPADDAN